MSSRPFPNQLRTPAVRNSLALLAIGCVLPIALVAGFLIINYYNHQRQQLTVNAISRARAMMAIVDHDFASTQSALQALATSRLLAAGDLEGFHVQAREAVQNMQARNIVLLSPTGRFLLTTLRPYGEPLPMQSIPPNLMRALATGKPAVSDLFKGRMTGGQVFSIGVPVRRDGATIYSLNATVTPGQLSGVLAEQKLPATWRAAITDSSGSIVARTHDIAKFLGKPVVPDLWQRMSVSNEGGFESRTLDGIAVLTVYSRSPATKWAVVMGIPLDEVTAGLSQTVTMLIGASIAALAAGLMLAWYIGGRIASSIKGLMQPARALGSGTAVTIPPLHFREAEEMGLALLDADATLRQVQYEAHHDVLTGLPNRTLFHIFINRQLALCRREQTNLAILYLDLDGFKSVNDTHGHAVGDLLLHAVATRITHAIREADIAARLGGDEFAIALLHSNVEHARAFAGKLIDTISAPYLIGDIQAQVSASIGVAGYPASASDIDTLLKHADRAMYKAKELGKRTVYAAA